MVNFNDNDRASVSTGGRVVIALVGASLMAAGCGGGSAGEGGAGAAVENEAVFGAQAALVVSNSHRGEPAKRPQQVLVFGDSLSDVGTYNVGLVAQVGGGKFTTNPGPVWAESVGFLLGASVKPFRQGFGGVSRVVGGSGFAMGGSRVSRRPGILCKPDPITGACTAALAIPVTEQISDYLAANGDRFTNDQLTFLQAGANDILFQLGTFQAKAQAGVPIDQAQTEALDEIRQAAIDLTAAVQRIVAKGGSRIVVLNVPDIGDTPLARLPDVIAARPLLSGMVQMFNGTLAAGLRGTPAVLIDLETEFKRVLANPAQFNVAETALPACDPQKIATITGGVELEGLGLYCSTRTLVSPAAPFTHLFADILHPSTLGHLIIARRVVVDILKAGLL